MPNTITLTEADAGVTRALKVDQEVLLNLEETPSTGYRWFLEAEPSAAVENLGIQWNTPDAGGVGAAGRRVFHLRVLTPGEIQLRLKLWRQWQGDASVTRRLEFTLHVQPPNGT